MKKSMNKGTLRGNLVKDPDIRFTATKKKVARVIVAVNGSARVMGDDGKVSYIPKTEYLPVIAFGRIADLIEKYLRKGSSVAFDYTQRMNEYDSEKYGRHVWQLENIATNIYIFSSPRGDGKTIAENDAEEQASAEPDQLGFEQFDTSEGDIAMAATNYAQYAADVDIPF